MQKCQRVCINQPWEAVSLSRHVSRSSIHLFLGQLRLSAMTNEDTELGEAFQITAFSLLHWLNGYVWIFLVTPLYLVWLQDT